MLKNAIVIWAISFFYYNRENLILNHLALIILTLCIIFISSLFVTFINEFFPKYYRKSLVDLEPKVMNDLEAKFNFFHQLIATKIMVLIALIFCFVSSILSSYSIIFTFLFITICYFFYLRTSNHFVITIVLNLLFLAFVFYAFFEVLNFLEANLFILILSIISARIYVNELAGMKKIEERCLKLGLVT